MLAARQYKVNANKIQHGLQKEIAARKAEEQKAAREKRKKDGQPRKRHPQPMAKSEAALIAHALHSEDGRDKVIIQPDGSAFYLYREPTCIHCGCIESNACPGACSWSVLETQTNRGLCSACGQKKKTFVPIAKLDGKEVAAMSSKKSSKKKSKKKSAKASNKKTNAQEAPAGAV
jgi:hypothetical protein